jgi:Na+/proline symporter
MSHFGISSLDLVVLIFYLLLVTVVGIVASRRAKSTAQYFLGDRRFGKWIMVGQSFGTGTHAEMPVSLAGAVYTAGLSGIWYQWKNLFSTPFYWLMAPLFRRFRRTTLGEVVEDRYGPWMGAIYTVFALCFFTINMASMLKGAAKVIVQAAGTDIPANEIVVAMTAVFIIYSLFGGLVATAWTDLIQGFLIIALSFMLIPFGWGVVGGIEGMKATLEPNRFSLAAPGGIGPWFIAMLTLNGLIGIAAQPQMIAAVGTGQDEFTCRVGHIFGTFIKRFCTIGWAFVGLMVSVMVARGVFGINSLPDPEHAFGFACRHLLFPGGIGLLIACILAANMAGCSAFMVDSGALFTNGFYQRYVFASGSDRHYLWAGRLSGLAVALVSVFYAVFLVERVLYSFLLTETMATFVGVSLLGGIFWRRANRWGALASLVAALGTNFGGYYLRHERLDHWHPTVFLLALVASVVALVLVSIWTEPEPITKLQQFYTNIETPSDASLRAAVSSAQAANGPRDVQAGHQLILANLFHLRRGLAGTSFWRAYRTDLIGFALGWVAVFMLVGLAWLLFHL